MSGSEVCHGEDPADCQSLSHTHHINAALFIGHESMLVGGWLVTTSLLDLREAFKKKEKKCEIFFEVIFTFRGGGSKPKV